MLGSLFFFRRPALEMMLAIPFHVLHQKHKGMVTFIFLLPTQAQRDGFDHLRSSREVFRERLMQGHGHLVRPLL